MSCYSFKISYNWFETFWLYILKKKYIFCFPDQSSNGLYLKFNVVSDGGWFLPVSGIKIFRGI